MRVAVPRLVPAFVAGSGGVKRSREERGRWCWGGRKVPIRRPRVQATDGSGEIELESFQAAANADLLEDVAVERMLAGLATRRFEPPTSRSARTWKPRRRRSRRVRCRGGSFRGRGRRWASSWAGTWNPNEGSVSRLRRHPQ